MQEETIERKIKKVLRKLLSYKPQKVILFGGAARGELNDSGDIDFLMIKNTSLRFHEREREVKRYLRGLCLNRPLDIVVYTPEEFEKAKKEGRFFLEQILKEGKVLYETK